MVAVRRAERRAHADVHAAVARHHDERGLLSLRRGRNFAAADTLVVHLDQAGQRRGAVLEQVVDVGDAVGRFRVTGRRDHGATGLEQDDNIAFEDVVRLAQHREEPAAGARAVSRGNS